MDDDHEDEGRRVSSEKNSFFSAASSLLTLKRKKPHLEDFWSNVLQQLASSIGHIVEDWSSAAAAADSGARQQTFVLTAW